MNERVKQIRLFFKLTQNEFGEKLGITRSAISYIESGRSNLTEQMIIAICNIDWDGNFINEQWLRTGNGSMFEELPPEDEYFKAVTQLNDDENFCHFAITYWKSDKLIRKAIWHFIKKLNDINDD